MLTLVTSISSEQIFCLQIIYNLTHPNNSVHEKIFFLIEQHLSINFHFRIAWILDSARSLASLGSST